MKNHKNGFTLIETMVGFTILALMVAMMLSFTAKTASSSAKLKKNVVVELDSMSIYNEFVSLGTKEEVLSFNNKYSANFDESTDAYPKLSYTNQSAIRDALGISNDINQRPQIYILKISSLYNGVTDAYACCYAK